MILTVAMPGDKFRRGIRDVRMAVKLSTISSRISSLMIDTRTLTPLIITFSLSVNSTPTKSDPAIEYDNDKINLSNSHQVTYLLQIHSEQ